MYLEGVDLNSQVLTGFAVCFVDCPSTVFCC